MIRKYHKLSKKYLEVIKKCVEFHTKYFTNFILDTKKSKQKRGTFMMFIA